MDHVCARLSAAFNSIRDLQHDRVSHPWRELDWVLTWEDILLAFAIFLLWIELIKSTRAGSRSIMDHVLAMALFIGMLVEFLLVQRAATSTFFLLMAIVLVDVLAGFIVGMRSATRQIEIEHSDPA
jgi:hypothetical protein